MDAHVGEVLVFNLPRASPFPESMLAMVSSLGVFAIGSTCREAQPPAGSIAEAMVTSSSHVLSHRDSSTGTSPPKSHSALAAHRCHLKPTISLSLGTILSPQ